MEQKSGLSKSCWKTVHSCERVTKDLEFALPLTLRVGRGRLLVVGQNMLASIGVSDGTGSRQIVAMFLIE